ncbi:MAG: hypothetical protein V4568_17010 [Pseudomonadota bacterium]
MKTVCEGLEALAKHLARYSNLEAPIDASKVKSIIDSDVNEKLQLITIKNEGGKDTFLFDDNKHKDLSKEELDAFYKLFNAQPLLNIDSSTARSTQLSSPTSSSTDSTLTGLPAGKSIEDSSYLSPQKNKGRKSEKALDKSFAAGLIGVGLCALAIFIPPAAPVLLALGIAAIAVQVYQLGKAVHHGNKEVMQEKLAVANASKEKEMKAEKKRTNSKALERDVHQHHEHTADMHLKGGTVSLSAANFFTELKAHQRDVVFDIGSHSENEITLQSKYKKLKSFGEGTTYKVDTSGMDPLGNEGKVVQQWKDMFNSNQKTITAKVTTPVNGVGPGIKTEAGDKLTSQKANAVGSQLAAAR